MNTKIFFSIYLIAISTFCFGQVDNNKPTIYDPLIDAKVIANDYCKYLDKIHNANIDSLKELYTELKDGKFKTQFEAKLSQFNKIQYNSFILYDEEQSALANFNQKLNEYKSNYKEYAATFEQKYKSIISSCGYRNNLDSITLQKKINALIKKLVDKEPDLERIKFDMIGTKVPGYSFNSRMYLYINANISSVIKVANKIEYTLDLEMQPQLVVSGNHNIRLKVFYIKSPEGWVFQNVKEIFITYSNSAYGKYSYEFKTIKNCEYSFSTGGLKCIIKDPCSNKAYELTSENYKWDLNCDRLQLTCPSEDKSVRYIITYFPKTK